MERFGDANFSHGGDLKLIPLDRIKNDDNADPHVTRNNFTHFSQSCF